MHLYHFGMSLKILWFLAIGFSCIHNNSQMAISTAHCGIGALPQNVASVFNKSFPPLLLCSHFPLMCWGGWWNNNNNHNNNNNNSGHLCSFSNCAPFSDILPSDTCINMALQSNGEAYCTHQGHITLQTYSQGPVLSTVGIAHRHVREYRLTDLVASVVCYPLQVLLSAKK